MNFLVDAQLPRRLAARLRVAGHDARHTLDLPDGNRTTDQEILAIPDREDRVVVTKDADFVTTFVVAHQPRKLLLSAGDYPCWYRCHLDNTVYLPLIEQTLTRRTATS